MMTKSAARPTRRCQYRAVGASAFYAATANRPAYPVTTAARSCAGCRAAAHAGKSAGGIGAEDEAVQLFPPPSEVCGRARCVRCRCAPVRGRALAALADAAIWLSGRAVWLPFMWPTTSVSASSNHVGVDQVEPGIEGPRWYGCRHHAVFARPRVPSTEVNFRCRPPAAPAPIQRPRPANLDAAGRRLSKARWRRSPWPLTPIITSWGGRAYAPRRRRSWR